jgi:hypothetical protein
MIISLKFIYDYVFNNMLYDVETIAKTVDSFSRSSSLASLNSNARNCTNSDKWELRTKFPKCPQLTKTATLYSFFCVHLNALEVNSYKIIAI